MTLYKHSIFLFLLILVQVGVCSSAIVKTDNNEGVKSLNLAKGLVLERNLFDGTEEKILEQEILQELNHLSSRRQREIFDNLEDQHEKFSISHKTLALSETDNISPLNVEELKNIRKTIKVSNSTLPAIRNKRTLNFLLFAVARALGYTLTPTNSDAEWISRQQPPSAQPSTPPPPCRPNPPSTPSPCAMPPTTHPCSSSNALSQPATIPPIQIDANTIRYPYRPARTIPLFNFAPLPIGVTVPYPALLQSPTQKRPLCTGQQPSQSPCSSTSAPPTPPCGTTSSPCKSTPSSSPPPCGVTPAPSLAPCPTTLPPKGSPPCKPTPPSCGTTVAPSPPPCGTTVAPSPPPCGTTIAPSPPPCGTTVAPSPPPCGTTVAPSPPPCTTNMAPPPPCATPPAPTQSPCDTPQTPKPSPCGNPTSPPYGNPQPPPPPSSEVPKKGSILLEYDDPVRIQIFSNDKKFLPASGSIYSGHENIHNEDWHSYFFPDNEKNKKEDFEEMEEEHIEEEGEEDQEAPGQLKHYEEEDEPTSADNEEEDESETNLSIVKKPAGQDIQKTEKRRLILKKTKTSNSNDKDKRIEKEDNKYEKPENPQKIKKPKRKKWIRIIKKQRKTKTDSNPQNNFQIYNSDAFPEASHIIPKYYGERESQSIFDSTEKDVSDFSDDSSSRSSEDVSKIDLKKVTINNRKINSPDLLRTARNYELNFNPYALEPEEQRRKKLEKAVERYVEDYVEKQLGDELIKNTGVPKTTFFEFSPKNGPKIQTITTTVAKTSHSGNSSKLKPQIRPEMRAYFNFPAENAHLIKRNSYEEKFKKRGNFDYEDFSSYV